MIVKLSSKGQLVIPKSIRQALFLEPGSEVDLKLVNNKVILQPVIDPVRADAALEELHGLSKGIDLFGELKRNRQFELERDEKKAKALRP